MVYVVVCEDEYLEKWGADWSQWTRSELRAKRFWSKKEGDLVASVVGGSLLPFDDLFCHSLSSKEVCHESG